MVSWCSMGRKCRLTVPPLKLPSSKNAAMGRSAPCCCVTRAKQRPCPRIWPRNTTIICMGCPSDENGVRRHVLFSLVGKSSRSWAQTSDRIYSILSWRPANNGMGTNGTRRCDERSARSRSSYRSLPTSGSIRSCKSCHRRKSCLMRGLSYFLGERISNGRSLIVFRSRRCSAKTSLKH